MTRRPGGPSVVTEERAATPQGETPARSTASVDATGSKVPAALVEDMSAPAARSRSVDQDVVDRELPSSETRRISATGGGDDGAGRIHRESSREHGTTEGVVPASDGRPPLLRDDSVQLRPSQLGDDDPHAAGGGECVEDKSEYEGENNEDVPTVAFEEHCQGGKVGGEAAAEGGCTGEGNNPDNITTPDDDGSNADTPQSPGSPLSPGRPGELKEGDPDRSPPSSARRKRKTGKGDGGNGGGKERGKSRVHGSRSPTRRRGRRRGSGGGGCTGGRDWAKEAKRRKKIYKKMAKVAGAQATGAVGVSGVRAPAGDGAGRGVAFSLGTGERWGQGEQWAQQSHQQQQHRQQYDGTQSAVDLGPGYGMQNAAFEQR